MPEVVRPYERLPVSIHGLLQQFVQPEQLSEIESEVLSQLLRGEFFRWQLLAHKTSSEFNPLDVGMICVETTRTSFSLFQGVESILETFSEGLVRKELFEGF